MNDGVSMKFQLLISQNITQLKVACSGPNEPKHTRGLKLEQRHALGICVRLCVYIGLTYYRYIRIHRPACSPSFCMLYQEMFSQCIAYALMHWENNS